jgi:hypothetical protein
LRSQEKEEAHPQDGQEEEVGKSLRAISGGGFPPVCISQAVCEISSYGGHIMGGVGEGKGCDPPKKGGKKKSRKKGKKKK